MDRYDTMRALYSEGKTYDEIGRSVGVSRQRAHQILNKSTAGSPTAEQIKNRKFYKSKNAKGRSEKFPR